MSVGLGQLVVHLIVLSRLLWILFKLLAVFGLLHGCFKPLNVEGRDCRDGVGQCGETISGVTNSHDHNRCNLKTHTVSSWKKIQHGCRLKALGDKMISF